MHQHFTYGREAVSSRWFGNDLAGLLLLPQAFPPGSVTYVQRLHDTKGLKSLPVTVVSKEGFLMGSLELQ